MANLQVQVQESKVLTLPTNIVVTATQYIILSKPPEEEELVLQNSLNSYKTDENFVTHW